VLARWLIIDGNNLIHASPDLGDSAGRDFNLARRQLVHELDELVSVLAEHITVVFDGAHGGKQTGFESSAVEVIFSPSHFTADSVIERLAARTLDRDSAMVVSSDSLERHTVEASGVQSLSCRSFLDEMRLAQTHLRRQLRETVRKPGGRNNLGHFFP
jgi:ribosomal protection tetracycline resistance protein